DVGFNRVAVARVRLRVIRGITAAPLIAARVHHLVARQTVDELRAGRVLGEGVVPRIVGGAQLHADGTAYLDAGAAVEDAGAAVHRRAGGLAARALAQDARELHAAHEAVGERAGRPDLPEDSRERTAADN